MKDTSEHTVSFALHANIASLRWWNKSVYLHAADQLLGKKHVQSHILPGMRIFKNTIMMVVITVYVAFGPKPSAYKT